jgi:hypothetical protein
MKKPKYDVANAFPDLDFESAGLAHGLNLLLLAIAKTNPAVGALLDEFTSMHAEYLAEIQALARESVEHLEVLQKFSESSKLIYKRLSALDAEQSAALRAEQQGPANPMSVH